MSTIFDRFRVNAYKFPRISNMHAHSAEVASFAVRIAAATYGLTMADQNSDKLVRPEQVPEVPFRSLQQAQKRGEGSTVREWFGPEGGGDSFVVNVVGGGAFGVLIDDTIFVGFRGTTDAEDWTINLFGISTSGPIKVPIETEYWHRKAHFPRPTASRTPDCAHGGFYRVSQALARAIRVEINQLRAKYRERHGNGWSGREVFCGHSLGGALALFTGMMLNPDAVYTFGMPRVAERGLLAELPANHYRYVLEGDPVPKFPSEAMGFSHDMPSLTLDPYRGLEKPGFLAKAIKGFKSGRTLAGRSGAALQTMLAAQHDMELYVEAVMRQ